MAKQKKDEAALVVAEQQMPAFLQGKTRTDMRGIGAEDVSMPRIKLLQALSPEVQEGTMDQMTGLEAKAGEFWHSLADRSLGDAFTFVPILVRKRYILWDPAEGTNNGDILARSNDGVHWNPPSGKFDVKLSKMKNHVATWELKPTVAESGLHLFGSSDPDDPNSPPAAVLCYDFLVHPLAYPELSPSVIICQKTQIVPTKKLLGKLKMGAVPVYGRRIQVESVDATNAAGQAFKNLRFSLVGYLEDEDLFNRLEELNAKYDTAGFDVKNERETSEQFDESGEDAVF